MINEKRYDKILKLLEEKTYVKVDELVKALYVSPPTVRRDLATLHSRGAIVRIRGGAKRVNNEHVVIPIDFRKSHNSKEKSKICRAAVEMIAPHMLIFIDASTTVLPIIDLIPIDYGVLVVTNGITAALKLTKRNIANICLGGTVQNSSLCFVGEIAEDTVRNFNFDLAFISSGGMDQNGTINDASLAETMLRKQVIKASERAVFLIDDSKIGKTLPYNLGTHEQFHSIITNSEKIMEFGKVPMEKLIIAQPKLSENE